MDSLMTEKEVKYAGFYQRLLAHNIDLIPILLLLYTASLLIPRTSNDWLIFLLIYLAYHTAFELSDWKATPGKKCVKISVHAVKIQQGAVAWIILRNLSKILSLLLLFGGFVMILLNKKKRGLHDFIGGTVVLFDE